MSSRSRVLPLLLLAVIASLGVYFGQAQTKPAIAYPRGYRSWNLAKTMVIFSNQHPLFNQFAGLHNIYVNDRGLASLQRGRAYPDGTIFVFDLYDIRTFQGAIETRDRKFLAVMQKNSKLYPETGGWGFELFRGYEQKGSARDMKLCFECHESKKSTDYVYSTYSP